MTGPERERWEAALKRNLQGMEDSHLFMSLFTAGVLKDPMCLMQFGLAVLLDKPIIIVAAEGTPIPGNVRAMALAVEFYKEGDVASCTAAVKRAHKAAGLGPEHRL